MGILESIMSLRWGRGKVLSYVNIRSLIEKYMFTLYF